MTEQIRDGLHRHAPTDHLGGEGVAEDVGPGPGNVEPDPAQGVSRSPSRPTVQLQVTHVRRETQEWGLDGQISRGFMPA